MMSTGAHRWRSRYRWCEEEGGEGVRRNEKK